MSWILDALTVGVIAAFAISSYRKGFLNTIVVLLGSLGAMFVSLTYSQPAAEVIYQRFFYEKISAMVAQHLGAFTAADAAAFAKNIEDLAGELPAVLSAALESELGIYVGQWYQQLASSNAATVTTAITDTIIGPLAIGLLRVVTFFIMFSLLMMLVNIVAGLLKTVNHLPLIGTFNELLGGVLGAIQGMLYVFVISAVLWFLISASGGSFGPVSADMINQTLIFKYFYTAGPWVNSTIKLI
ncbi:MAG TPA: CvpA family protein [Clostridia bacterium]|nr:CvpA family protein [Clostridia bacterium]